MRTIRFFPTTALAGLIYAAALASLAACRSLVLENRQLCPALLRLELANDPGSLPPADGPLVVSAFLPGEDRPDASATTTLGALRDSALLLSVHRAASVRGFGLMGSENATDDGHGAFLIPEGCDGDPVWRFGFETAIEGESVTVPVTLHKEHARVTVRFINYREDPTGDSGGVPFRLTAHSRTAGLDALTGAPREGAWTFSPPQEEPGLFRFTVPRQGDHSLSLRIEGENGLMDEWNLWALFDELAGYDWSAPDLPDISLEVRGAELRFAVTVRPWGTEDGLHFEL